MAQSAQAAAFRLRFHDEYEAFKKSQLLKREMDRARTRQLSKSSTRSASYRKKSSSLRTASSNAEATDYAESMHMDDSQLSGKLLALPSIQQQSQTRSLSAAKKKASEESMGTESTEMSSTHATNAETCTGPKEESPVRAASSSSKRSNQKFEVKVLKMNIFEKDRVTPDMLEAEAKAQQERKEQERVVSILMDHGMTAALGREVSKRASEVEGRSAQSISAVKDLIGDYEHEMEAYKARISRMEAAEVERLQREIAYREELAANHGKPRAFWRVPVLNTLKRQTVRNDGEGAALQFKPRRANRSQQRTNKFALDETTLQLKALLIKRKEELSSFFVGKSEDSNEERSFFSQPAARVNQQHSSGGAITSPKRFKPAKAHTAMKAREPLGTDDDVLLNLTGAKTKKDIRIRSLSNSSAHSSSSSSSSGSKGRAAAISEQKRRLLSPRVEVVESDLTPKEESADCDAKSLAAQSETAFPSCSNSRAVKDEPLLKSSAQLSPLKQTAKYEYRLRSSISTQGQAPVLRTSNPERPSSVYSRNSEAYRQELQKSMRASSGASQRLQQFRANEQHVTAHVEVRRAPSAAFQPMGLVTGRDRSRHQTRRIAMDLTTKF